MYRNVFSRAFLLGLATTAFAIILMGANASVAQTDDGQDTNATRPCASAIERASRICSQHGEQSIQCKAARTQASNACSDQPPASIPANGSNDPGIGTGSPTFNCASSIYAMQFDGGGHAARVAPQSLDSLQAAARQLDACGHEHADFAITVEGDDNAPNRDIARRRLENVREGLIAHGVDPGRIRTTMTPGAGSSATPGDVTVAVAPQ